MASSQKEGDDRSRRGSTTTEIMQVPPKKKKSSLKKIFGFGKKSSKGSFGSEPELNAVSEISEQNDTISRLSLASDYEGDAVAYEENESRESLSHMAQTDSRDSIYFDPNMSLSPSSSKGSESSAADRGWYKAPSAEEVMDGNVEEINDVDDDDDAYISADGRDDEEDMNDFLNDDELIEELDGAIEDEVEAIIALRYSSISNPINDKDDMNDDDDDDGHSQSFVIGELEREESGMSSITSPRPRQVELQQDDEKEEEETSTPVAVLPNGRRPSEEPAAMFGWGGVQVAVHKKSIQEAETANKSSRMRSDSTNTNTPTKLKNHTCSECSACFIDASDLEEHIKASHGRLDKSICEPGVAGGDQVEVISGFTCPECMQQFDNGQMLKEHFESYHSGGGGGDEESVSSGTKKLKSRRASLLAAGKSLVKAARSAKAEETILKVSRRVTLAAGGLAQSTANQAANESENGGGFDMSYQQDIDVSDTDLLHSFASLLGSLKDPAYMKAFVNEREGVVTLATMADHIVQDAEERARQLGRKRLNSLGDEDEEDEDDQASDDEYDSSPAMVLSANEVMLQHCVLKAVLTVLDSEPGLEYILEHEDILASIFTSIQASNQLQHMGKMYAIITSLCYLGDEQDRGKVLFMRCLDAVADSHPSRPRFDGVCRLLCDADSSWKTKLQALGTLNTLVIVGDSEEERLDLRAEVGRALTALAVEFEMPLDALGVSGANRQLLEDSYLQPVSHFHYGGGGGGVGRGSDDDVHNMNEDELSEEIPELTKHRTELIKLWEQLVELRGGGERGEVALESCLAQCSTLPVLLHLRLLALRVARGLDDDGAGAGSEAEAQAFIEKLDLYEKTCIQDRIDIDTALEKLAPSQDIDQDDEVGRMMVLDAKERVVTRLTMMMQQLQREAVSMGPIVDSFTTALLDLILMAVSEELTPAELLDDDEHKDNLGLIRESGEDQQHLNLENELNKPNTTKKAAFAQAMSLSDSHALMETVMQIQALETSVQQFQLQQHPHHSKQSGNHDNNDFDLDAVAAGLRPSYSNQSEISETSSGRMSRAASRAAMLNGEYRESHVGGRRLSMSGGGGGGGGDYGINEKKLKEAGELAAKLAREEEERKVRQLEEEFKKKVASLEERMNVYKSITPVSEDEMQWLIESKGQNAYLVAEKKEADTQAKYSATMAEADVHGMVSRLLKNHPARRVLDNAAKADFSTLFAPPPPPLKDENAAPAPPKFGAPPGGGGRPDMAAMLGGALAKKQAKAQEEEPTGRPDMATMLGGALAKKQAKAQEEEPTGRPDMAAMLGGALAKKQAKAQEEEPSSKPDLAAMFAGKGGKGGKGGGMGGLLGGIAAGRGGGLGGIGGGLGGLKKKNSPMTTINSLKKEKDKANTELAAVRNRGSKVPEASLIVDALSRILDAYEKGDKEVKDRKILEENHKKQIEKYEEYYKEIKKLESEVEETEQLAKKAEIEAKKILEQAGVARAQASEALSKAQSASLAYDQAIGANMSSSSSSSEENKNENELNLLKQIDELNEIMKLKNIEVENIEKLVTEKSEEAKKLRNINDEAIVKKNKYLETKKMEQDESNESPPSLPPPLPTFDLSEIGKKVGEVILKEKENLETIEQKAIKSANDCQLVLDELQTSLEKWAKRKREAPERDAAEAEREHKWAEENKAENEIALKKMRSFMPANLSKLTSDEFEALIAERGGRYPPALLERLKGKKMLLWVITHPTNITSANFLAGAHKVSFVNLQEYDFIEMRAVYAVLPPYFLLDSTPHHEHEKKNWREGFVKTLKDLIIKNEMKVMTPLEARNPAYFYPTLEEANSVKAKWQEATQRINEEEVKLPDLRSTLANARAEYDKITIESREPALREILSKDTLREWVKEAKAEVTKATKALAACEDKLKRMKAEVEKNTETRQKLTECYDWCRDNDMYGKPVDPVFDENPELEVESSAYKKLTDEEEVALRNAEKAALLASRQEADKGGGGGGKTDGVDNSEHGSDGGGNRFKRGMSISGRKSISGNNQGLGMRKGAKKDFMALLDSTLGGKKQEGGERTKSKSMFGGKSRKKSISQSTAPPKPKPKPQVVLKKGTSTKLAELLKSKNSIGNMLSEVIVVPEQDVVAPLPNMSPLSPSGRKGGMKKSVSISKRTSVSFADPAPPPPPPDDDHHNSLDEGNHGLRDGVSEKPADWDHREHNDDGDKKNDRMRSASLRGSVSGGSGTMSSLLDAASDDQLIERMRMKNIQDGDAPLKRVASKATIQDYGTLRRQQSRAAIGANDRFTLSNSPSFSGTPGSGSLSISSHGGGGGNSGIGMRSLSRTASVAAAMQRGGAKSPRNGNMNTSFGFRGHPASSINSHRMKSFAGNDMTNSKSLHRFPSGSIGNSLDLLSNTHFSESRPRRNSQLQQPTSRSGVRGSRSGSAWGSSSPSSSASNSPMIKSSKIRATSLVPPTSDR